MSGSDNVPEIRQELAAMRILKRNLSQKAMKELEVDERTEELKTCQNPFSRYYGKPLEYALHRTEFYECQRCKCPFFGGYVDCQLEQAVLDEE